MNQYDYFRPKSLREAHAVLQENPGAKLLAGGTDLFVQMRKRRLPKPGALVSLRNVAELGEISAGDQLRIGATAPMADIASHPVVREVFPALAQSIATLGSPQIRNVATLGGNLCNASPAADTAPPLLVYEASVELLGPSGVRTVALADFFVGPGKTTLAAGEIMTAVLLDPRAARSRRAVFMRKSRVHMDLASVILCALIDRDGDTCARARIAVGSVAPVPMRLRAVEERLEGEALSDAVIEEARALAMSSVTPITDVRSTEEYRRDIVGVFLARALRQLRSNEAKR